MKRDKKESLAATLPWLVISSHLRSKAGWSWQVGHETSKENPATGDAVSTVYEVSPQAREGRGPPLFDFPPQFYFKAPYTLADLLQRRKANRRNGITQRVVSKIHGLSCKIPWQLMA